MSKLKLRNLELTTYIKETESEVGAPLFIVNTMKRNKGRILFSCMGELGKAETVIIPATWIPVDLTEQAQRSKLIDSTEFKSLLRKGVVTIVAATVDETKRKLGFIGAEDALRRPECKAEYEAVLAATGSVASGAVDEEAGIDLGEVKADQNNNVTERDASDLALSIVAREQGGEPEETLVNAFRTKLSEFDAKDLTYIANNVTSSSLSTLALESLEDLENEGNDGINI